MENRPIERETAITENAAEDAYVHECEECAAIREDMGLFYSDGLTFTHPDAD